MFNISKELFENLRIRDRGNGEVQGKCPICNAEDAGFNVVKGCWNCFRCGENGKLLVECSIELEVKKEPELDVDKVRELYTSVSSKYNDSVHLAIEYLKKRGLTEETIQRFKLGFCPTDYFEEYSSDIAESSGIIKGNYPCLCNRITIPYIYNKMVTDIRGRVSEGIYYKDDTPKYMSLRGSRKARGSLFMFNHDIIDYSDTVVVTEGEFKAILASQYGIPIVATPGISIWDDSWTKQLRDKRVVLIPDRERVPFRFTPAYNQVMYLKDKLPDIRIALLPFYRGKDKIDIDSLILDGGIDALKWAIKGAITIEDYLYSAQRKDYGKR
jgi:DNA primase